MHEDPQHRPYHEPERRTARRFLQVFILLILLTASFVAAVNLYAYRYMLRPENQAIVQLLAGWGRVYKPILYDEINPEVAVYGASWARDAFDPIETGELVGMRVFNHAVSGGTPYETRRFADASLDNPNLKAVIVNLDTFYRSEQRARNQYGFDESILDVDEHQQPNRFVGLRRVYSLALAGWAVGANLKLISAIIGRDQGLPPPDYLPAYEQADHVRRQGVMDAARQQVFPSMGEEKRILLNQDQRELVAMTGELEILLDRMCAGMVDIYAYFTPAHIRQQSCDVTATKKVAVMDLLRAKQANCDARIHFYDFAYPNAMTLEGVLTPITASQFYRPDGHPRPTAGLMMAARMLEREFPPGTPGVLQQDFGVDLLAHDAPESWLLERAARCEGDWGEAGYGRFVEALTAQP